MGSNGQPAGVTAALATIRQALEDITDMEPGPPKTRAIRDLTEELQELYGTATAIRKAEVLRIQETEKLSLAKLADRVGISKARADQILTAARKEEARDV